MKRVLIFALALSLIGVAAWGALDKADYRGGVFFTDRHNAVIAGFTSDGYFEPLAGINLLDDIDLSFGGTAGGTIGPLTMEWTTADSVANCFLVDLPIGGATDVPVMILASSDTDFGYFEGTVEPTLAVENLAGTGWVGLDHSGTTLARLYAGGAATLLTIKTELAGSDIVLDAADAAANTAQEYVNISGSPPAHTSGTKVDVFLDFEPTLQTHSATSVSTHLIEMTFSTPAWDAGISNVRGIYFAPTIGDAAAGTNTVALLDIAGITADAQVNLYGLRIGDLTTAGASTENAVSIGTGWDEGVYSQSSVTIIESLTVGVSGVGHTVTFYGDTAGDEMVWSDTSKLLTVTGTHGAAALTVGDGNFLVQSGTLTVGGDGDGYDATFYSDTAGDHMVWSTTDIDLTITGTAGTTGLDVVDANVTFAGDFTVHTDDFIVDADGNITIAPTLDIVMNPTGGDLFITGDTTQTGSMTLTVNLDVDGITNLDNTDIDGTFTLDGTTAALTCSTSVISYTPIFTFGYASDAAMTFTTTTGTGAVAITHAGTDPVITWAANSLTFTGIFEVIGASTFDGMTVSGVVTHTNNYNITGDITQTGSTTITADLDVDGTTNLDVVDIDDAVQIDGTVTIGTFDFSVDTTDFVVDVDGNISMIPTGGEIEITGNTVQTGSIIATSHITTSGGNFVMGSTTITETEIGYLDGLTIGVVTASKAVVVDASKDIGTFGTITAGTFTDGAATLTGGALTGLTAIGITGNTTQTGSFIIVGGITHTGIQTTSETITAEHLVSTDDADINDNLTVGDIIIDEAQGVLNFSGTQSASITVTTPTFIGFETATFEHRYSYTGLGYDSAIQTPAVNGLQVQNGEALTCVGLDGGAAEIGTTEGYVSIGDIADFLRFVIPIPCLWVDSGQTTSLVISFDIKEEGGEECNIGIRIFEYGDNVTAIVDDALVVTDGDSRQWEPLVTLSTGFGAVATLTADDSYLIIEVTPVADTDDFYVYGVRLLYQTGIQATQ